MIYQFLNKVWSINMHKQTVELYDKPTSDHTWRSYLCDYYIPEALMDSDHSLRVRLATWNLGDRFKKLDAVDSISGKKIDNYNNPWNLVENAQEYRNRKAKQLAIITNQIMRNKADVLTLQEGDILSYLFDEKFSHPNFSPEENASIKSLITRYRDEWKKWGYEILPITRKVPAGTIAAKESNERDGWLQHTHIIYNSRLMTPARDDAGLVKSYEPLFPKKTANKNREPFYNYRGVGQEFRLLEGGLDNNKGKPFFVFSMHLDYESDNREAIKSLLLAKQNAKLCVVGAGDTNTTPGYNEDLKLVNPQYASSLHSRNGHYTIIDDRSGKVRALDGPVAMPTKGTLVIVRETGGEAFIGNSQNGFSLVALDSIPGYQPAQFMSEVGAVCSRHSAYNAARAELLPAPPSHQASGCYSRTFKPYREVASCEVSQPKPSTIAQNSLNVPLQTTGKAGFFTTEHTERCSKIAPAKTTTPAPTVFSLRSLLNNDSRGIRFSGFDEQAKPRQNTFPEETQAQDKIKLIELGQKLEKAFGYGCNLRIVRNHLKACLALANQAKINLADFSAENEHYTLWTLATQPDINNKNDYELYLLVMKEHLRAFGDNEGYEDEEALEFETYRSGQQSPNKY